MATSRKIDHFFPLHATSLLFIFFLLLSPSVSSAAPFVDLAENRAKYPLGPYMKILEDKSGNWAIQEVSSHSFDHRFVPCEVESPSLGQTKSSIWVRFRVVSRLSTEKTMILQLKSPLMDHADLYVCQKRPTAEYDTRVCHGLVPGVRFQPDHSARVVPRKFIEIVHLATPAWPPPSYCL